jgi:hypothetical protein
MVHVIVTALLAVVSLTVLPLDRLRLALLATVQHALRLLVLGGLAGTGLLYHRPDLAPSAVLAELQPLFELAQKHLPPEQVALVWPAVGLALLFLSLPLLVLLEVTRSQARLARELRLARAHLQEQRKPGTAVNGVLGRNHNAAAPSAKPVVTGVRKGLLKDLI